MTTQPHDIFRRISSEFTRRAARSARRSRRRRPHTAAKPCESLEPRSMLAVTAAMNAGILEISLGAANDAASLAYDGTDYTVTGTGPFTFTTSGVSKIKVLDTGTSAAGQIFEYAGTSNPLAVPLATTGIEQVDILASVEISGSGDFEVTNAAAFSSAGVDIKAGKILITGGKTVVSQALEATAGNVTIVATDDVTISADVKSQQGDVSLSSDKNLAVKNVEAQGAISLTGKVSVIAAGKVESRNGFNITVSNGGAAGTVWLQDDVETAGDVVVGAALTTLVKIGNSAQTTVEGGSVSITATDIRFQAPTKVESKNQGVSLAGPVASSQNLDLIGNAGVTASKAVTLDAGDLKITATNGDISLSDDVTVISGQATLAANAGTLAAHENITSFDALSLTTKAGFVARSGGYAFTSNNADISIDGGLNSLDLGSLAINAETGVTLTGDGGIEATGTIAAQTGNISATSNGKIDLANLRALLGTVSARSQTDEVIVDLVNAQGDITLEAFQKITTTGTASSAAGDVFLQGIGGGVLPAILVGDNITALGGKIFLTADVSGTVTLAANVKLDAKEVAVAGQTLALMGDAEIAASDEIIAIPTSVNAAGVLKLTGPGVQVNGFGQTAGSVAIEAATGDIQISDNLTSAGSITLTAANGTLAAHKNLTAGTNLTVGVKNLTAGAFAFTAGPTGSVTVTASNGALDLSAPTGLVAGARVTLAATNGNLTVDAAQAGSDISLSALGVGFGEVNIKTGLTSTSGSISVNAVDLVIADAAVLDAQAGSITLVASNNVRGPSSSEVKSQFLADSLSVTANGQVTPSDLRLTNIGNKVAKVSVTLADASNTPNGAGIEFVNDTSVEVLSAVTNTGPVTLWSLSGLLTVTGKIGDGSGVQVGQITLAGKTGVVVGAASGLTANASGDTSITSSAGDISVLAPVTLSAGKLDIIAFGSLTASGPLTVSGVGNDITLESGTGMSVSGAVTSQKGDIKIDAQGGLSGLQATAPLSAFGKVTITAANGATLAAIAAQTGEISVTSAAGPITAQGDITASAASVTLSSLTDDVSVSGDITALGAKSDVTVIAGAALTVSGDIEAGNSIDLTAPGSVAIGPNSVIAQRGTIAIESTNDSVTLESDAQARNGWIVLEADETLQINGTSLAASTTYTPPVSGVPQTGLIRLVGTATVNISNPSLLVDAGRLEIVSGGTTPITLMNSSNAVGSVSAITNGAFEFTNSTSLSITDFNPGAPSVQVSATDVKISSALGLRVVDGIKYSGTNLTLTTPVVGGVDFVTTSAGDAATGFTGSLRNMIQYTRDNRAARANDGVLPLRSTIFQEMSLLFDEPGSPAEIAGSVTLSAALPALNRPVNFDGSLFTGTPVTIDGSAVATGNGLQFDVGSSLSIVQDATFANFANGAGIAVGSARNKIFATKLQDNACGVELASTAATRNLIGIAASGEQGNTLRGNATGIRVKANAAYNEIHGNTIQNNTGDGVVVEASIGTAIGKTTSQDFGNRIEGNVNGIRVKNVFSALIPYGASILNNTISANSAAGVLIEGGGRNQVGGETANSGNIITLNTRGVELRSSAAGVTQGNLIVGNTITSNTADGVTVASGLGNVVRANTISGSSQAGVRITGAVAAINRPANQVVGNTIDANGDGSVAGDTGGVVLDGSSGQIVGGLAATARNVIRDNNGSGVIVRSLSATTGGTNQIIGNTISGNIADGVRIRVSNGNAVQGNTLVANAKNGINVINSVATTAALGNRLAGNEVSGSGEAGVRLAGGARTTIGGTLAAQANKIHSNTVDGIAIAPDGSNLPAFHVVQGNRIGIDGSNTGFGVSLTSASDTTIDSGNVISTNTRGGVSLQGGARNLIGSTIPGRGNRIHDNLANGITLDQPATPARTQAVTIAGNSIQGNTGFAVEVKGARTEAVTIGRVSSVSLPNGSENVIRNNALGGVLVDAARQVTIVGNEFIGNGTGVADDIRLSNNANANITAPVIASATRRGAGLSNPQYDVRGTVSGPAGQRFFVDFYGIRNDGRMFYLGRVLVTAGAGNTATFRAIVGPTRQALGNGGGINSIVATSTSAMTFGGGTSAMSNAVNV